MILGDLLNNLIEWTKHTFVPLGWPGLFLLAFIESFIFPVPPDVLIIILTLANPDQWWFFALIATIGSTLGGMMGYLIGYIGEKTFFEKLISKDKLEKAHNLFEKYEVGAIFIAGFTPVPYKVFTIAAGLFYINFKNFVLASIASRGLRFFLVAFLVYSYGEKIIVFISRYFEIITITIGIILILVLYFVYYKKDRNKDSKKNEKNKKK